MPRTLKILAQSEPAAATETDVFTASYPTVLSSIVVCNKDAGASVINILVAFQGLATDTTMFLYYGHSLNASETLIIKAGITIGTADVIRCESDTGLVTFSIFGQEQN